MAFWRGLVPGIRNIPGVVSKDWIHHCRYYLLSQEGGVLALLHENFDGFQGHLLTTPHQLHLRGPGGVGPPAGNRAGDELTVHPVSPSMPLCTSLICICPGKPKVSVGQTGLANVRLIQSTPVGPLWWNEKDTYIQRENVGNMQHRN